MKTCILICAAIVGFAGAGRAQTNSGTAQIKLATQGTAATNRITGQISITQNNGESVILSYIKVWLVDADKFTTAMDHALSYKAAKKNDIAWRERAAALVKAMPSMSATNRATAKATLATLSAQIKTNQPYAQMADRTVYKILEDFEPAWQAERRLLTDAKGHFSILVPNGNWVIAARARRKVFSLEEKYAWTIPVSTPGAPDPISLNNSNLMN